MPVNSPINIPPSRPLGSTAPKITKIGIPSVIGRAQSTEISKLQQRTDRDAARVSMNQVLNAKAEENGQRVTSINRIGTPNNVAHTSVAGYATNIKTSINAEENYDQNAEADERRYAHMQRLIRARKAKEKAAEKIEAPHGPLSIHTGTAMRTTGATGFHKQIGKFFRSNRQKFSALSKGAKNVLETTIEDAVTKKVTGSSLTRFDKIKMKKRIMVAKKQGTINLTTAKKFKGIINKLG